MLHRRKEHGKKTEEEEEEEFLEERDRCRGLVVRLPT
jgi:hypothetical protein